MNNSAKSRNTAKDLNQKIKQHLEELAKETDKARRSEEMVRYLDFSAKFHQYSPSNILLILMAKPEATYVAGFQAWKKLGRYVKRGEKGIAILAPHFWKDEDSEGNEVDRIGFHVTYVFDVSQTDGDPLPEQPNWKSPEKNLELQEKLIEFSESNGIKVTIEPLHGETQGVSMGGRIILSPEAGTKTLIHELAHELLHKVNLNQMSRSVKEMEAEAVAYVVCKHFCINQLNSPNYIALHKLTAMEMFAHMSRIQSTAGKIMAAIALDAIKTY